jgi:hypothetical protein
VPGHGPIGDRRRSLADVDHVAQPSATFIRTAMRLAQGPPGPQAGMQLATQIPFALNVNRLIDHIVRHPHLRIIGKVQPQPASDLSGTVLLIQPSLHFIVQPRVGGQLARRRTSRRSMRAHMRRGRAVARLRIPTPTP